MSTTPGSVDWTEDEPLTEWLLGIMWKRPRYAGRFLSSIASAIRYSSPSEYELIRPMLLELRKLHPEFRGRVGHTKSSAPESASPAPPRPRAR